MQPALRLASNVLRSRPPFWEALFDLYNRRPVDNRLVPKTLEKGTSLTSVWLEIDQAKMYPEAKKLQELGFDAKGTTHQVLTKLIRLGFENFDSRYTGLSGGTNIVNNFGLDEKKYIIDVRIAPQMVWPLLVQEYSAGEKTAVSMHIANTLLHELSVRQAELPLNWAFQLLVHFSKAPRLTFSLNHVARSDRRSEYNDDLQGLASGSNIRRLRSRPSFEYTSSTSA